MDRANKPDIVFEDSELYILNKPFGMSSQDDLTSSESVLHFFPGCHVITRLDKRVGGLMVLARNEIAAGKYSQMLKSETVRKEYHCVVANKPDESKGTVIHWIRKEAKAKVFLKEEKNAKKAILHYDVVESSDRYHLLKVQIETGRFHQIRAQLSAIGSPIVGDLKYGFRRSSPDGSIFLCCTKIQIGDLSVEIPLPSEWKRFGLG